VHTSLKNDKAVLVHVGGTDFELYSDAVLYTSLTTVKLGIDA